MKKLMKVIVATAMVAVPSASFADNFARDLTGAIYGAAGSKACGSACGVIAKEAGKLVFDGNSWITNKVGDAGAKVGKKIREKVCSKRKC